MRLPLEILKISALQAWHRQARYVTCSSSSSNCHDPQLEITCEKGRKGVSLSMECSFLHFIESDGCRKKWCKMHFCWCPVKDSIWNSWFSSSHRNLVFIGQFLLHRISRRRSFSPLTTVSQSLVVVKDLQRPGWLNFWMKVLPLALEGLSMLKTYNTYIVLPLHQAIQQMIKKHQANHHRITGRGSIPSSWRCSKSLC